MFRSFGHDQSSVLDGGLPRWEAEGHPTETGPVIEMPKSKYPAPSLASENIRSGFSVAILFVFVTQSTQGYEQMVSNAAKELSGPLTEIVLDARSHGRYIHVTSLPNQGLIPCAGIWAQTLSPDQGCPRVTYLIPSLFHSTCFCRRTPFPSLARPSRHSSPRTSSVGN